MVVKDEEESSAEGGSEGLRLLPARSRVQQLQLATATGTPTESESQPAVVVDPTSGGAAAAALGAREGGEGDVMPIW